MYSCIIINTHAHTYQHPIYTDLFELVVHTGDRHWEVKSRKTTYINVHQSAEMLCPARMSSSEYTQLYTFRLLVPIAGKDNRLNKVCTHYNHYHFHTVICSSVNGLVGIELTAPVQVSDDDHHEYKWSISASRWQMQVAEGQGHLRH